MNPKIKSVIKYAVVVLTTVAVTLTAVMFTNGSEKYLKMLIRRFYVDEVDAGLLSEGANAGMLAALGDEHTFYIPAEYGYDTMEEEVTGEYVGIGVTISPVEDYICVVGVFKNSPAAEAGILAGDKIARVDGEDVKGKTADYVSSLVRGEEDSMVTLTIIRDGGEKDITVQRRSVDSQSVSGKLVSDKIGYVSISSFDSDTAEELLSEVNALGETDGLIIDLRDNPGGLMNTAVKCVDMFIDGGNIVIARYREDEEIYTADKDVRFTMPVVVLVNENSASASEIFSAALKENDRAEIVGSTTYGKGSIQQSFMLPGNAGANITVGKFFSPDGNAINKVGVTPDYEVTLPDELKGGFASQLAPEEDTQLQKAIELLKKQ